MCKDHEQLLPLTTCFYSSRAAPGGTLSDDMTRTEFCLFTAQEDLETMQAYAQVTQAAVTLYHFFQTRILTILLAFWSGHQLVSLNKPMAQYFF